MTVKKPGATEIVIPTWANRRGVEFFGGTDQYTGWDDEAISYYLPLRGHVDEDKYSYMRDDCQALSDLVIYGWFNVDGTISLDLRYHAIHSAKLHDMERRTKLLKRLNSKVQGKFDMLDNFTRDSTVHAELTKLYEALGVKRTMQYHGIGQPETFAPAAIAIKLIADAIDARLEQQRERRGVTA